MKPDQWSAPSWLEVNGLWTKRKVPSLGEGEGVHVHTRVHSLTRTGHRLDLSPAVGFAQKISALPAGRLCSSVNSHRQKVNLEPDGLCLVKTTLS